LIAERDGATSVAFPAELLARRSDPKVAEAITGEQRAFATRKETWRRQAEILNSRKAENGRIHAGLQSQQTSLDTQLGLVGKETTMVEQLVQRGIEGMPRLLALQRQQAQLGGQRGEVVEKMAQVTLDTGEIDLQLINLQNQTRSEVLAELREVQTKRFDLMERVRAARDVLNRLSILAPETGRVVGLAVHTPGGVVRAGETLMEIVPQDDLLDVEAHVAPEDIDEVQVGVPAGVTLTAYKLRRLPTITGHVTEVSADRLVDQRTGVPYFRTKVAVDRSALAEYPEVRLVPGMPVEVAIETGSRTMLEYLLAPISGVMRRGMRET
jgi:HlyD family type I secretion membrane fusion protein